MDVNVTEMYSEILYNLEKEIVISVFGSKLTSKIDSDLLYLILQAKERYPNSEEILMKSLLMGDNVASLLKRVSTSIKGIRNESVASSLRNLKDEAHKVIFFKQECIGEFKSKLEKLEFNIVTKDNFTFIDRFKIKRNKIDNIVLLYKYAMNQKLSLKGTHMTINSMIVFEAVSMAEIWINMNNLKFSNCAELLYKVYKLNATEIERFYMAIFPNTKIMDKVNEINDATVKRELKAQIMQIKLSNK